jgi:hypothetical protein
MQSMTSTTNDTLVPAIKAAYLAVFSAGAASNAPLKTPIIDKSSGAKANATSTAAQTIWASYKLSTGKLWSYAAYDTGGDYLAASYDPFKMVDNVQFRSPDPAACSATTSKRGGDVQYSSLYTNCTQRSYVNSAGYPGFSYENKNYDPRVRPWYTKTRAAGKPTWSDLYVMVNDVLNKPGSAAILFATPIVNASNMVSLEFGFALSVDAIQGATMQLTNINSVNFIMTNATKQLVATSTGESVLKNGTIKYAWQSSNQLIREVVNFMNTSKITTAGYYRYYSSYWKSQVQVQLGSYVDPSATLALSMVVAAVGRPANQTYDALQTMKCIVADLNGFVNDAIFPAKYLVYHLNRFLLNSTS